MTDHKRDRQPPPLGRVILWIALALLVALAAYLTVLAARANPYLTEHPGGVGKFRFLDQCKDELRTAVLREVPGARLKFAPAVQQVESAFATENGWQLQSFVVISAENQPPIGAQFACDLDQQTRRARLLGVQPAQ